QAAELADKSVGDYSEHTKHLTDTLWMLLEQSGHDVRRNGHPVHCLPNTLSVGFRNIKADELVASLSDKVAISAGAACHASGVTISSVLQAMNVLHEYAMGTIRISLGRYTTLDQVHTAAQHILSAVSKFQT
ncbi:MAG: aminotransferase class V-fold PLP-dependent enzyme, partial [Chloroflexota bacterium]